MTKTKLARTLASGRLAITAECRPPRSGDAAAIKKLSAALPPGLDAVVVADNHDEIHGSALACAAILATHQVLRTEALVARAAAVVSNVQSNLRLERFMEIPLLKDIPRVTLVPDICSPWECSMGVEAGR